MPLYHREHAEDLGAELQEVLQEICQGVPENSMHKKRFAEAIAPLFDRIDALLDRKGKSPFIPTKVAANIRTAISQLSKNATQRMKTLQILRENGLIPYADESEEEWRSDLQSEE